MKPHAVLSLAVLPLLFLLGVVTILTYSKFRTFIEYAGQADHARAVMVNLANVVASTKDAETNQRGFLLTGDSAFIFPYRKAITRVDYYAMQLDGLAIRDSQGDVDSLQMLLIERMRIMKNVLSMKAQRPDVLPSDSLYAGKHVMEKLQRQVDRMIALEQRDLNVASMETKRLIAVTPMLLLVLSMFSIGVLLISYLFISRELRMRLDVQRLLENKIEALNRSNRELEQFAYVASHDLQEPLRKIQAFGDRLLMKHEVEITSDMRTGISKMQHAAARMQVLIDDLLAYSRVLHLKEDFHEVDLNVVLDEVLMDLEISIRNKNATIESERLPVVNAVSTQMQQLFLNLLGNAIKFSKTTMPPRVRIAYDKVKGSVVPETKPSQENSWFHRIAVTDEGVGFNGEYSKKIFVIFQQLHNKMEFGGTGIGLAVCKKITENHGGFIEATSKPGEGSTFYVYLPVT